MRNIYYFNITYGCNSNCIFCYSHNTRHNNISHNEIPFDVFKKYIEEKNVSEHDRIIINGGEPLLHTHIKEILYSLISYNCEVLIYTNGRLLNTISLDKFNHRFRFIVPIHGHMELHDSITGVEGSYYETVRGMRCFEKNVDCKLDLKVILNSGMVHSEELFTKTLMSFSNIYFNNAVHLTKMADTIISKRNNCVSIDNNITSKHMERFYLYFKKKANIIKIFDTCIKDLEVLKDKELYQKLEDFKVYFKDKNQESEIILGKPVLSCSCFCKKRDFCISAVGEYRVLELYKDKIYENLE